MRAIVFALAAAVVLPGCASWDQIWNGREVPAERTEPAPASQADASAPGSNRPPALDPRQDGPEATSTAGPTSDTETATATSSSSNSTSAAPQAGPDVVGSGTCDAEAWHADVAAAQAVLANLSALKVAETVAGYVNGSYVSEHRLFDLKNRSLSYSSFEDHSRFVAVGSYYAVYGQDAYRGRDDSPAGIALRHVVEALADPPLAAWRDAAPASLAGECHGSGENATTVARLEGSPSIEMHITGGLPRQASVRGPSTQLEVTYDYASPAPVIEGALPARAVPLDLQVSGNQSLITSTDARLLDGHLVLHALDENGYAIFAVALTESHAETREDAYLAYMDDGDGYWSPGDRLAWGGSTASVRVLDTWAGQFAG